MRKALEQYLLKRWYSQRPIGFLKPLSWLYAKIASSRRQAYLTGQKESYKAPVPIIVVGNITVGGTGKTPIVIFLVEELKKKGLQPAVISRGYGASVGTNRLVSEFLSYHEVGDEPKLIQQRTGVPVAVGRNRGASIELILEQHPEVDAIISDDGLQHYALERDIEIAVIDAERGLGNEALLPAGPLRETKERLEEVDSILVNGDDPTDVEGIDFSLQASELINLKTQEKRSLASFSQVEAFAGIGNPERFFSSLRAAGLDVNTHFVGDHGVMSDAFFVEHKDKTILMTEKDAIKLTNVSHDELWYLPVAVEMSEGDKLQLLDTVLSRVKT